MPSRPAPQLISVVMPVLNAEAHVADQLRALSGQSYDGPWELVVADNGCTDRTIEIVRGVADRLPGLTIADATLRPGLNHARNAGAEAARGDFLAYCDSDDVVAPDWLAAMARAAPRNDVVGGRMEYEALNPPEIRAWSDCTPMTALRVDHGFLHYAPGGNLGVWTEIVRELGWDERFRFGSSDHAFTWRAQLEGFRLGFAPDAVVHQRFRRSLRALAAQYYRYGKSGALVHRVFRPDGIPPPDNRRALRRWRRLLAELPRLRSRDEGGRWLREASFRTGRLVGCVRDRVLCL